MMKTVFDIAAGAMSVNRLRINTIASNIANAQTTRTAEGGPYKRRDVAVMATPVSDLDFTNHLDEASLKGVSASAVVTDSKPPTMVYDPGHPDANPETGMVAMPNISPVTEMVNMVTASAAYKAAASIIDTTKDMASAIRNLASRI